MSNIYVVFRNDDICALNDTAHERRLMDLFKQYHIPQTVAVVPNVVESFIDKKDGKFHLLTENTELYDLLKERQDSGLIEVALHGYTHQTNRFHANLLRRNEGLYAFLKNCKTLLNPAHNNRLTHQGSASENRREGWKDYSAYNGVSSKKWFLKLTVKDGSYSEFKDLPYSEQLEKVSKGKELLENWFNTEVVTFIPPFNSHNCNTIKAAGEAGMKIFSSQLKNKERRGVSKYTNIIVTEANSCLRNFENDLKIAKRFISDNNLPVAIIILYHSWMYNSEEKISLLKRALESIIRVPEVKAVTFKSLLMVYPEILREFVHRKSYFK